ncbi:hypothetical protein Tco_0517507, partial [Tanacetum coccineum]
SSTVAGRDDGGREMMAKNIRGESLMRMKMGTGKAMMDLAMQFDNASAAKNDLRKAYEKCNDIP